MRSFRSSVPVLGMLVLALGTTATADDGRPVQIMPEQIREHIAKQYAAIAVLDQAIADMLQQLQARDKTIGRLREAARACKA